MPDKTNTIGVIVHKLDSYFITCALKGMEEVAAAHGYELVITHSQESMEKEVANAGLLLDMDNSTPARTALQLRCGNRAALGAAVAMTARDRRSAYAVG